MISEPSFRGWKSVAKWRGSTAAMGSSPGQLSVRGLTVGQLVDDVSIARGKHTFKTGIDLRVELRNNYQPGQVSGLFDFRRAMSGNPQDTRAILVLGSLHSCLAQ